MDLPSQTVETGYSVIEDIYTLDLSIISWVYEWSFIVVGERQKNETWERISPSGRIPGAMTHISLTQTNGVIYVFGLSEGKSVLWAYNIGKGCEVARGFSIFYS